MVMNKRDKKELEAMVEKLDHPEKEVKCPKCGELLQYFEHRSYDTVECPTEGCCKPLVLRGL